MITIGNSACNKPFTPLYFAVATSSSPRVVVRPVTRPSYSNSGVPPTIGTAYANPATLPPTTGNGVAFNSQNNVIVVACGSSPRVRAYPWAAGFGTAFANPASTVAAGSAYSVAFNNHAVDQVVIITNAVTPHIEAYQFSSTTGWGTKYSGATAAANPTESYNVQFQSDDGGILMSRSNLSGNQLYFYVWTYASGFGTQTTSNPFPAGDPGYGGCISPMNDTVFATGFGSPYVKAYPYTPVGTLGTVYANPSTLPPRTMRGVTASQDGKLVVVSGQASSTSGEAPFFKVYAFTPGTGWGTAFADNWSVTYGGPIQTYCPTISPDKSFAGLALTSNVDDVYMVALYSTTGYPQQTFTSYSTSSSFSTVGDQGQSTFSSR